MAAVEAHSPSINSVSMDETQLVYNQVFYYYSFYTVRHRLASVLATTHFSNSTFLFQSVVYATD